MMKSITLIVLGAWLCGLSTALAQTETKPADPAAAPATPVPAPAATPAAAKADKTKLPAGAVGFAGMVTAKVVAKPGNEIQVEVTKIEKSWKHSKAENAESLVGKTVTMKIVPSLYAKKPGYAAKVEKFFNLLKVGDATSFDCKADGDVLVFLELTHEQLAQVEK